MVIFIIWLLIIGLIVGAIARLLLPGRDPIGIFGTIVVGIAGSFIGGFLENLIEHHTLSIHSFHPVGLIGSVIGALLLLLLLRLTGLEPGRRHR
jgi:uncharacterized membrane protein YeaQ/YmgE (transglycosylase-associated protein family)